MYFHSTMFGYTWQSECVSTKIRVTGKKKLGNVLVDEGMWLKCYYKRAEVKFKTIKQPQIFMINSFDYYCNNVTLL